MAYSFFNKSSLSSSSPKQQQQPPAHPTPPRPPQSTPALRAVDHSGLQPQPYAGKLKSQPTPHPQISVVPVNTAHIPSLTRITGLLLPIRYPNGFYTATITDPVIASLSRIAIYHNDNPAPNASSTNPDSSTDKVIGGIRCRLEPLLPQDASGGPDHPAARGRNLYIQTLVLLSPYRGNGVATSLLNSLLFDLPPPSSSSSPLHDKQPPSLTISPLVRHYRIRTVTAHVHETNEDALHWYIARGFTVEEGIVQGYYRRLNPGGARVVRLTLPWDEEAEASEEEPDNDGDDDDWVKIEAEDADTADTRSGKGGTKRKAGEQIGR